MMAKAKAKESDRVAELERVIALLIKALLTDNPEAKAALKDFKANAG